MDIAEEKKGGKKTEAGWGGPGNEEG